MSTWSSPQAIRPRRTLPQLHRSILAAGRVQFPVGTEADGPDRSVMAFARLEHLLLVVVPDTHPRVAGAAGDELALAAVKGDAGDLGGHADRFEQVCGLEGVEEVDAFAGGN